MNLERTQSTALCGPLETNQRGNDMRVVTVQPWVGADRREEIDS